jgi:hypothetical protein
LAVVEPDRVADPQSQQIRRVGVENLPPDAKRQIERAARPCRKGGDMQPLACVASAAPDCAAFRVAATCGALSGFAALSSR